ncbi:hypothetical protein JTB14_000626 [Gonioctena quinquepunctata]|nr:hypothetical protein JTB14_000626 [Gonioctena quinquepunctata]
MVKEKNNGAKIHKGYLYINGKKYSAEQLEENRNIREIPTEFLILSAPPKPTTEGINKSESQQGIFTQNKVEKPEATKIRTANPIPLNNFRPRNKSTTQTDRNSSKKY